MQKKIKNPFSQNKDYNCFGCSPNNPYGLHMEFVEEGDEIVSYWDPAPNFQGWFNVVHGGIQSTLMDEIASWYVFVKLKTGGVTSHLEVKYKKPVPSNQGKIILKARLIEMKRNIAVMDVKLYSHTNELCTIAIVKYYTFPQDVAKEKLWYPEPDEFNEENHNCCSSNSKK